MIDREVTARIDFLYETKCKALTEKMKSMQLCINTNFASNSFSILLETYAFMIGYSQNSLSGLSLIFSSETQVPDTEHTAWASTLKVSIAALVILLIYSRKSDFNNDLEDLLKLINKDAIQKIVQTHPDDPERQEQVIDNVIRRISNIVRSKELPVENTAPMRCMNYLTGYKIGALCSNPYGMIASAATSVITEGLWTWAGRKP